MKIPSVAKRVFKGIIFDVYHWQQQLYDGSFATFEGLKRPASVQVIPTYQKKFLLSYEKQPGRSFAYSFLGGRQEEGEDPLATAQRELREETGLVSNNWQLIRTFDFDGKIEWTTYLFAALDCSQKEKPQLEPGEQIQVREYSFEGFMDIASSEQFWGKTYSDWLFRLKHNPTDLEKFRKIFLASGTT